MKDGTHGTINTTTSLLAFADLLIPSFLRRDSTGLFSAFNLGMVLDFGVRYAGGKDRGTGVSFAFGSEWQRSEHGNRDQ